MPQETTFLFTDIEGSTRLWEQEPLRMQDALAVHDQLAREAVLDHRGTVVKMTGDGLHAAFDDALDALRAALQLQLRLTRPQAAEGLALAVRCGLHSGENQRRDGDFYGTVVNRAARIMSAAHGGQVLLSAAVAQQLRGRLEGAASLRELGMVRLRDLSHAERIYQLVHPELRNDFPALRSLEDTPNNLPHALSSFVGRERELAELRVMLRGHRLLSIVGMGGLGKTRLALQLGAAVLDDFIDGVWFVELAPLQDGERVVEAVAAAVGVKQPPGQSLEDELARHVRGRSMLFILDNCEHLLAACGRLAHRLMSAGEGVAVVASSREPLRLMGEATYPIGVMSAPGPRDAVGPESAARFDAVRLFGERAMAASPAFRLTRENVGTVAAICHRLDGIPLAIELAAARVRALSVKQIALRLDDRFRLLNAGDPTISPRQRTLRALIDWSHELLTPAERRLFAQLSVFSGGWSLEAAEMVCGGDDGEAVVDVLTRLVEKSLVTMEADGERYSMLETVRQYARDQLEAADANAVHRRHLDYVLRFAEQAKAGLVGPDQAQWLARLDRDRENVLAAHAWACNSAREVDTAMRLAGCVKLYWINRGLLQLGHRLIMDVLALAGAQPTMLRCRGLYEAGQFCWYQGRYGEARANLEESLAIARDSQDARAIAGILQPLGMAAMGDGDLAAARGYLEEALERARALGNPRQIAAAAVELGQLHRLQAEHDSAETLYRLGLELATQLGDDESRAISQLNLAMLCVLRGQPLQSRRLCLEALAIAEQTRSRRMTQSVLDVCAGLAASAGEWDHAARFHGAAESQSADTGLRREPADQAFLEPLMRAARSSLGERDFARAWEEGRTLTHPDAAREARAWLATPAATARAGNYDSITTR